MLGIPSDMTYEDYVKDNIIDLDKVVIIGSSISRTKVSKNIISWLDKKYLPYITDNLPDCGDIDLYFAEIPNFHIANTFNNKQLWNALKGLLICGVDERLVNEEKAVLTIIEGLGKQDETKFLDGLFSEKIEGKTVYRKIFEKLDDWGGDDNFTTYIHTLYYIWKESNYVKNNLEKNLEVIPYTSSKLVGFYTSDYKLYLNENAAQIKVIKNETEYVGGATNGMYGAMPNKFTTESLIGEFGIYQPVNLINYLEIDTNFNFPDKSPVLPLFILQAIASKNYTSNVENGIYLTIDVISTLSGVGNLAKLRHLRHLKTLKKLETLKIFVGAVEVSSGTLGTALEYSDCDTDLCKKMRTYLFVLEIVSLSVSVR